MIPRWTPILLVFLFIGFAPAEAEIWMSVPMPPHATTITSLHAGQNWLFAAVDSAGVGRGLYRTPVAAPGGWELLGLEGFRVRDILACGTEDRDLIVTGIDDYGLRCTHDAGVTWAAVGPSTRRASSLTSDGVASNRVWTALIPLAGVDSSRVYQTTNRGDTWTPVGAPDEFTDFQSETMLCAARDGTEDLWHFAKLPFMAGYWGSWTPTGSGPWTSLSPILGTLTRALAVRETDGSRVYVLEGDCTVHHWREGTYEGSPWFGPIYAAQLKTCAWAPDWIFAGGAGPTGWTALTAAMCQAEGGLWVVFRDGLPDVPVPDPRFPSGRGKVTCEPARNMPRLFLHGEGAGLWMRDMTDLVAGVPPLAGNGGLRLSSPMPNPSSESVLLRWVSPLGGPADIIVCDALGRRVRTFTSTGAGELRWDGCDDHGRKVPAGCYWLELSSALGGARQAVVRVR